MGTRPLATVVPLDGSGESETILACLKAPLRDLRIDVTLFRVAPEAEHAEEAKAYLEEQRRRFHSQRIDVFTALGLGRPAHEIATFAKVREAGLIAMTTHGRSALGRAWMGSVAEEVLHHTRIPLLLARPGQHPEPWDRVLIPLDGSPEAEAAIPLARRLSPGAKLDLVQVQDKGDPLPYLTRVRERLVQDGGKAMPVAREGRPGDQIVRHAGEAKAGLICMTTHNRTGVARLLAGSVAEHVLRHAPCPVVVVPPG